MSSPSPRLHNSAAEQLQLFAGERTKQQSYFEKYFDVNTEQWGLHNFLANAKQVVFSSFVYF